MCTRLTLKQDHFAHLLLGSMCVITGTTAKRGNSLVSEFARLTSISAGGRDDIDGLKTKLLAHVAGLDRGFAANKRQVRVKPFVPATISLVFNLASESSPARWSPCLPKYGLAFAGE